LGEMETFDRLVLQTIGLVAAFFGVGLLFNALFTSAGAAWSAVGSAALLALSLLLYRRTRGLPSSGHNSDGGH
jgi:hypothetical protein